ncbi:GtrA family protein [Bacillus sp. AGMB 02131]|uniref:GtrA family protein n=1 Tax=Peribacillus faecalis TaxID=2772559 RepID=A0A927CZ19_9BACI|nr:GtrA family protein [Peribacillus faecalis]MBD3109287.1 GtrA family protein [Peribacillus faecalis]
MNKLIKFCIVGMGNTLLTFLVFYLLLTIGMNYLAANIIGYTVGVANSYYWNKSWVFEAKSNYKHFLRFIAVNILTLLINTGSLFIFVHSFGLNEIIAQIIATGIGMVVNFILNKIWTFNSTIA